MEHKHKIWPGIFKESQKKKTLKESLPLDFGNFGICFTSKSKPIPKDLQDRINEESSDGIIPTPLERDTVPFAWDSSYKITSSELIISGHVDASGFGKVNISLPLKNAKDYYFLQVSISEDFANEIRNELQDLGYELKD